MSRTILRPIRSLSAAVNRQMAEPGGQNAIAAAACCLQGLVIVWLVHIALSSDELVVRLLSLGFLLLLALVNNQPPKILAAWFPHVRRATMQLAYLVFLAPVLFVYFVAFYAPA